MNSNIDILIVEDEVIVALDIEQRLLALGYNVIGAIDNGEEVLSFLESEAIRPDLLLLDIQLKGTITGIDISKKVMSMYQIPVVFLTANSNLNIIEEAQKSKPYGFVFKPFNSTDLQVALEIAINKFSYEKQLEVINNELEKRVKERTIELEHLNADLKKEIEVRNTIEEQLVLSKKLYENTVRNLGSGLALADVKGQIISVNQSLLSMLNITNKEIKKGNAVQFIGSKSWKDIVIHLKENDVWDKEYLIPTRLGEKYCHIYISRVSKELDAEFIISVIDVDQARRNGHMVIEERKKRMLSLFEGEERERKRISKELHDNLGQKLTAAKLSIGSVLLDKSLSINHVGVLTESKEIIEEAMIEVREVSQNLFPSVLSDFGIGSAINKIAERINNTGKIKCEVELIGQIGEIESSVSLNLFRICQEAISNAVNHSQASKILISIQSQNEGCTLVVKDNGKGMDVNKVKLGSGLNNMKERSSAIYATLTIESKKNLGTKIIVISSNGK